MKPCEINFGEHFFFSSFYVGYLVLTFFPVMLTLEKSLTKIQITRKSSFWKGNKKKLGSVVSWIFSPRLLKCKIYFFHCLLFCIMTTDCSYTIILLRYFVTNVSYVTSRKLIEMKKAAKKSVIKPRTKKWML